MHNSFKKPFALLFAALLCAGTTVNAGMTPQDDDEGNGIPLSELIRRNPVSSSGSPDDDSASALYAEGMRLRMEGEDRKALKRFRKTVDKFPDSPQAASAQKNVAELLVKRGKHSGAFKEYQTLLDDYGTQINNKEVLEQLYKLAEKETARKHMRWLFGGFTSPERAQPILLEIIEYGPETEWAPMAQYLNAAIYEQNEQNEEAVAAYAAVEYRWKTSPYAKKAAHSKALLLHRMSTERPYSESLREDALNAAVAFLQDYPSAPEQDEIRKIKTELRTRQAEALMEKAGFYDHIKKDKKAAGIYYKLVADDFADTPPAEDARNRLEKLNTKTPETSDEN